MTRPKALVSALLYSPPAVTDSFRQEQTSREAGTQSRGSGGPPDSRAAEERGGLRPPPERDERVREEKSNGSQGRSNSHLEAYGCVVVRGAGVRRARGDQPGGGRAAAQPQSRHRRGHSRRRGRPVRSDGEDVPARR